jgi:hypothetical protein
MTLSCRSLLGRRHNVSQENANWRDNINQENATWRDTRALGMGMFQKVHVQDGPPVAAGAEEKTDRAVTPKSTNAGTGNEADPLQDDEEEVTGDLTDGDPESTKTETGDETMHLQSGEEDGIGYLMAMAKQSQLHTGERCNCNANFVETEGDATSTKNDLKYVVRSTLKRLTMTTLFYFALSISSLFPSLGRFAFFHVYICIYILIFDITTIVLRHLTVALRHLIDITTIALRHLIDITTIALRHLIDITTIQFRHLIDITNIALRHLIEKIYQTAY